MEVRGVPVNVGDGDGDEGGVRAVCEAPVPPDLQWGGGGRGGGGAPGCAAPLHAGLPLQAGTAEA